MCHCMYHMILNCVCATQAEGWYMVRDAAQCQDQQWHNGTTMATMVPHDFKLCMRHPS